MHIKLSCLAIVFLSVFPCRAELTDKTSRHFPLMLAGMYDHNIDVSLYWKSEKLDGIRAIWDGNKLMTRSGRKIYAPVWFIKKLPNYPLEGELWAGRGNFHLVQTTVLDKTPIEASWSKIHFMLFDMPLAPGSYPQRYAHIVQLVDSLQVEHIKFIEHTSISSEQELTSYFDQIDKSKGEGVMLRKLYGDYHHGRGEQLLKMKKHHDAEAKVVGYKAGKGQLEGMVGSLLVQTESGSQFYIGSGLTEQLRKRPPQLGSTITFRYNGYTHTGIPKFARFLREKVDHVIE
ncbi:DNA ligase [Vibrio pectenicida]|uniref:DNA ligase n=1 Tax=Vibrio pectenicida TaxID=62763 RepID=A0A7Y4EFL1_9VIBR|nr:DNA ligase [Vibrio pectenicida]NOH72667.1 DNA ligase [Vibrio pectenicida]